MAGEFGVEEWDTVVTAESVTNWVLDNHLIENGSVLEGDGDGVSDGTLFWVMVVGGEGLVLNTLHLLAEGIDSRVSGDIIGVICGDETSVDEWDGNHVLNAVITIGVVVEWTLLVDDTDSSLLGSDLDGSNVVGGLAELLELGVESHGGLAGSLGVELSWERDLEENVLHDVRSVWALELELLTLEEDIVETPVTGGQDRWDTWNTSLLDQKGQVDGARASITSSPGLSGHGVWSVTVGSEGLSINESLGDGIDGLLLGQAQELGDDSGGSDLDEDDVVESNTVEGVLQCETSLDFVGLDHSLQNVLDLWNLDAGGWVGLSGTGNPVGNSENCSQVVGRMTPLSGQPAVIVIQPADDGTNVESTTDRVELVWGTWDLGSVWHNSSLNNWAQDLCALLKVQSLQTTAEGVDQAKTSRLVLKVSRELAPLLHIASPLAYRLAHLGPLSSSVLSARRGIGGTYSQIRLDLIVMNIVGNVSQDLVWSRENVAGGASVGSLDGHCGSEASGEVERLGELDELSGQARSRTNGKGADVLEGRGGLCGEGSGGSESNAGKRHDLNTKKKCQFFRDPSPQSRRSSIEATAAGSKEQREKKFQPKQQKNV